MKCLHRGRGRGVFLPLCYSVADYGSSKLSCYKAYAHSVFSQIGTQAVLKAVNQTEQTKIELEKNAHRHAKSPSFLSKSHYFQMQLSTSPATSPIQL